ncbi:hypothetical protein SAMN02745195_01542 [Thermoanaerobacter uzonensis DSM 18761]|uniref:Uncharacterized protein n=1 Tax=Thermoanaerobacter uzonensis DSM 18761 TaxID=1123369 RepID=A0A1M4XPA6_9THEO|nr:hypothetical protein [Thermoanaerobacter uzonensis]SHE95427.1 hypothetical protein SAMN02745195_01542 [Thermoanaerobacter uzonensis DSM 18761]
MKKLYSILKPYDSWWNDEGEEKNLEAKKALQEFYKELKKLRPSKKYEKNIVHFSYIPYLLKIKKALDERKYMRACNELISLMHYEPFLQRRIYYNVLKLLEKEVIYNSYDFQYALEFTNQVLKDETKKEDKIRMINFILDMIREDLRCQELEDSLIDFRIEVIREISKIKHHIEKDAI